MSKNTKIMPERQVVAILIALCTALASISELAPGCRQPDFYRGAP